MADSGGGDAQSPECLQGPSGQNKGTNHAGFTDKTSKGSKHADISAASFMETLAPEYINPPAIPESGKRKMPLDDMIKLDIGEDVPDPEIFEMKDVLGNGTIYKKILKKGNGQRVQMHERVRVWMVSEIPSTNKVFPEQILEFVVGQGDVVQALDLSVILMEVGEEARIFAGYKYMYGAVGMLPDIPGYSNFRLLIKLLSSETCDKDKMKGRGTGTVSAAPVLDDVPEASAPLLVQTKVSPSASETHTLARVADIKDEMKEHAKSAQLYDQYRGETLTHSSTDPMPPVVVNVTAKPVGTVTTSSSMQTSPPPMTITELPPVSLPPVVHSSDYPQSIGKNITDEMKEQARNAQLYDKYRGRRIIQRALKHPKAAEKLGVETVDKASDDQYRGMLIIERVFSYPPEYTDGELSYSQEFTEKHLSYSPWYTERGEHGVAPPAAASGRRDGWSVAAKVGGVLVGLSLAGALGYGVFRYKYNLIQFINHSFHYSWM